MLPECITSISSRLRCPRDLMQAVSFSQLTTFMHNGMPQCWMLTKGITEGHHGGALLSEFAVERASSAEQAGATCGIPDHKVV